MSPQYATPGVYIEEITGPGVIAGVGTSTAAFIGPAARGPLRPRTITTFDDFKRIYGREGDGWPYLVSFGKRYYLAHAVQGFFDNGGSRAVIVRAGTSQAARWGIRNLASEQIFQLEALAEGTAANGLKVVVTLGGLTVNTPGTTADTAPSLAYAESAISSVTDRVLVLPHSAGAPPQFVSGDVVELQRDTDANTVQHNAVVAVAVAGATLSVTLDHLPLTGSQAPNKIRLADIKPQQSKFRLVNVPKGLEPGSLIKVNVKVSTTQTVDYYAVVARTDPAGFLYLRDPLFQKEQSTGTPVALTSPIPLRTGSNATRVETVDFAITITDPSGKVVDQESRLSLDPFHSGYVFRKEFSSVRVLPPSPPPNARNLSQWRASTTVVDLQEGVNDDPASIGLPEYQGALKLLEDVDDVNMVCIPDGANEVGIQKAVLEHCLKKRDRIGILDVPYDRPPADDNSALSHRALVEAQSGFAALYYPWLLIPEPTEPRLPRPLVALPLAVPPSGHIAGVFARVDETLGVHHAPANTDVRGVMGLERILSDREQGLINLQGVNALRIFPGEGRVMVWGARTTGSTDESDWIYVNVRRLMLYIEESIEEGIRWAVFKPNDRPLWQSLKRTIGEFLDRVWKAGGLVGKTREQAYQVRIDEGLNPPSETALGRLFIEIRVAPVRPAEFIVVRIGLWDGGAEVVEG